MRLALNCSCEDIEGFLGQYSHFGAPVKDLSRFSALMHMLGDPQDNLRFVHIVGTNGKGSVAEFCTSALAAAGHTVGRFTSPYVNSVCERIAIAYPDGIYEISCADFARHLNTAAEAAEKCGDLEFSQFEILNAAAFLYYAEKHTDYVVLEAGIGGTLDSTNIIKQPEAAVITSIGLDHMKILGSTVEEIARSKCGVIKGGNAVAAASVPEQAMQVIRQRCGRTGAMLFVPDRSQLMLHGQPGLSGSEFCYKGQEYRLRMGGACQTENALTAIETLLCMGIRPADIAMGLERARIPARMELFRNAPGRPSFLLDGGHNPQAAQAVRSALEGSGYHGVTGVIGMMNTKDCKAFLREIVPCLDRVIFVDGFSDGDVPAEELQRLSGAGAEMFHDPKAALEYAGSLPGELVYFGGSFYFAAAIRKLLI